MMLHGFKLIFLRVANQLLDQILHCIDEILKVHLVLVKFISHNLDEDKVVVISGYLFTGHSRE